VAEGLESAMQSKESSAAMALQSRAFRELHMGQWDAIWPHWRTVYTFSVLIQIRTSKSLKLTLELIDYALIFGDELCRCQLTTYAGQRLNVALFSSTDLDD
jgi:hypothetical protein